MRVSVLVYRMEKMQIHAAVVVSAKQNGRVKDSRSLLRRLSEAITNWVCATTEGREAWMESGGDFNIGDLAGGYFDARGPDKSLKPYLEAVGIEGLDIDGPEYDSNWTYDTVLGDEKKIEAEINPEDD